MTRLAVAVLCAIGIGISAAAGPGDLVLGAKHAAVEFETVRISKPDGSVVTLRVPRGRPLTLLGSGGGTVLRAQTPETDRELGLRDPRPAGGAQAGARPDLTPGGGRVSLRAPTGRVDSRVRLSHPYLGTRTIEADLGAMTRGATAAAAPDRRALDDLRDPVVAGDGLAERRAGRGWRPDGDSGKDGAYVLDEFIVLEPGDGWDGPTQEPPPVGEPGDRGYLAKAIARWDDVPYQTFAGDFHIGLVAFHMNGIHRVEISLDNGPWKPITYMQVNPRTGVLEYVARIPKNDPRLARDRLIELRAIAYPVGAGMPRLLEPFYLFVNNSGTFGQPSLYVSKSGNDATGNGTSVKPFQTLKRALSECAANIGANDGANIFIQDAGRYDIDMPGAVLNHRWITIQPRPGLTTNDVIISAGNRQDIVRPNTRRLRFVNLSFDSSDMDQMYKEDPHLQWYDSCRWFSAAGWTFVPRMVPIRNVGYGGLYLTDSLAENSLYAFVNANLVRGCRARQISGDVFTNSLCVVQSSIDHVDGTLLSSHHSDLLQYWGTHENLLVYNITGANIIATQNFFLDHYNSSFTNCAFVNIAIQNVDGDPPFSQLNSANTHVLFLHVANPGQHFMLRDDNTGDKKFVAKDVVFQNCVVKDIRSGNYYSDIPAGVLIDHCHFTSGERRGQDPTTGDVVVLDVGHGYFSFSGPGVPRLYQSASPIAGLPPAPGQNRGAWPWGRGQ